MIRAVSQSGGGPPFVSALAPKISTRQSANRETGAPDLTKTTLCGILSIQNEVNIVNDRTSKKGGHFRTTMAGDVRLLERCGLFDARSVENNPATYLITNM